MSIYEVEVATIDGQRRLMEEYRGKVLLIVNVASRCGFTGQYAGLEELYRKYRDQGLVVLGFPCDQFAHQEPGDEEQIREFCSRTYDVSFPMFAKVRVNGADAHPLFRILKKSRKGMLGSAAIKWNFTKFLVNREGEVLKRYPPVRSPGSIEKDIESLLG